MLLYELEKSYNVRLILLSATPMKNRVDDIIDIINILRLAQNANNRILNTKEIFDVSGHVDDIKFKPNGE